MSLPASLYLSPASSAPMWYIAIINLARALGMGLVAILFGVIMIVAGRNREKGVLKPALIVMACVTAFTSYSTISLFLKG